MKWTSFAPGLAALALTLSLGACQPAGPAEDEILEFFSFGCNHCRDLDAPLRAFKESRPGLKVRLVPLSLGRESGWIQAKLFYWLEDRGLLDRLGPRLFSAIHDEGLNTAEAAALTAWWTAQGQEPAQLRALLEDDGLTRRVQEGEALAKRAGIARVPAFWRSDWTAPLFFQDSPAITLAALARRL